MKFIKLSIIALVLTISAQFAKAQVSVGLHVGINQPRRIVYAEPRPVYVERPVYVVNRPVYYRGGYRRPVYRRAYYRQHYYGRPVFRGHGRGHGYGHGRHW